MTSIVNYEFNWNTNDEKPINHIVINNTTDKSKIKKDRIKKNKMSFTSFVNILLPKWKVNF